MGSENGFWSTLRGRFSDMANFRLSRNEDKFDVGKPDVTFGFRSRDFRCTGFIELKYLERFPPRGGIVRIDHYTEEQRTWLYEQGEIGGRCFLLCQVGREYFLFNHKDAQFIGKVKKGFWTENAVYHSKGEINKMNLIVQLCTLH